MIIRDNTEVITIDVKGGKSLVPMREKGTVAIPEYHGTYEVTPNAHAEIELNTAGKKLERNIVVDEIPYYETHNEYGSTVYIGE